MNRRLALGTAFYALAALVDAHWTVIGLRGDLALEGNALMRAAMERLGIGHALWLEKTAVGVLCFLIAKYGEPEIRRGAPWIDKVPSSRWARAWMKSGERSWIAFVPLYGTALFQLLAAASWAFLLRRR